MLEDPETFLDVRYARLALVCTRRECAVQVPAQNGQPPKMRDFVLELPEKCLPEEAVILRAKHVRGHSDDV